MSKLCSYSKAILECENQLTIGADENIRKAYLDLWDTYYKTNKIVDWIREQFLNIANELMMYCFDYNIMNLIQFDENKIHNEEIQTIEISIMQKTHSINPN